MRKQLRPEELRAWIEGQRIANGRGREDMASMRPEEKLRRISRLMASARLFDLSRRQEGDDAVRELWRQLRSRGAGRE